MQADALDLPTERFALTYSKLGDIYGPISWFVVPGLTIVALNTYDAMYELLEKRGSKYTDRPRATMLQDLIGMEFITPFRQGDHTWRLHRKLLRTALSATTVRQTYSALFISSAQSYLKSLSRQPEMFLPNLKRSIGETISELTYGVHKDDRGNDYVDKQEELLVYSKLAAAGYLVDLFPILKRVPSWFPGAQFRRDAKKWREHLFRLRALMVAGIEDRMSSSEGHPSYVVNMLESLQKRHAETGADITENIQAVYDSGFSFYQAGADTTEITVRSFLLAMTLFPDAQARARAEIDCVIEAGRYPDFSDQSEMPYLHAVVLESLRWNPPGPL
ncbi:hypothetical protein FRB90_005510, partial [Tulasnella sp. 427]